MLLSLISLLAGANLVSSALVPGRGFDRIISIWLENQVSERILFV